MPIAIATALPASQPLTPVDTTQASSATGAQAASADFASFLLSQLSAGITLGVTHETGTSPADSETATEEATTDEAAQLFAALGLPLPAQPAQTTAANAAPQDTARNVALDAGGLPSPAGGMAQEADAAGGDSLADTLAGERQTPFAAGLASTTANDRSARFAATEGNATLLPAETATDTPRPTTVLHHAPTQQATSGVRNDAPLRVDTPLHDRQAWASDFGQKIVWMAGNERQSAQLTLNPPQMGPIEISLNVNRDTATALFVSANPEVRETIESALPRLREMLATAGITLGDANVSAESSRQQQTGSEQQAGAGARRWQGDNAILGGDSGETAGLPAGGIQRGNGLVDLFA